ncbi:MAG: EF-P lysine aminoacylase EpmA [Gammaproteobacteria bacterium]|nr:EF-P lysine aminoacylase EpmA [Gammaproteobacteria bacterium]
MVVDSSDWRASASLHTLELRAKLLSQLRQFFAERNVMEVETPLLGRRTVSDLHLRSFVIADNSSDKQPLYLQTSPEYAMKRLLACGSGSIYQLSKVFRREEESRLHNPEFTLLEWYRVDFSLELLMKEVEALLQMLCGCSAVPRYSYGDLIQQFCGINPYTIEPTELEAYTRCTLSLSLNALDSVDCLQLLMSNLIEPELPEYCFITDYPAAQAALAATTRLPDGTLVAQRFELYVGGMELANGYYELTDATEQLRRFKQDQEQRSIRSLEPLAVDERLLAAMETGLPACAGVALGVDRLLMRLIGADCINEVLAFPFDRA